MAITPADKSKLRVMLVEAVSGAKTPQEAFEGFQRKIDEWDKREHCITLFSAQKVREGIEELFARPAVPVIFFPGLIATD